MHRLISVVAALCLLAIPSQAQFVGGQRMMDMVPYVLGACNSTAVTYLSTQTSTVDGTSVTFTDVPIGDPPCGANNRIIVSYTTCTTISNASLYTMTIQGITETTIAESAETAMKVLMSATPVPTGTTATIIISQAGGADNTCERILTMLWAVISSSTTEVDNVNDASPTGDFDLSNVAVSAGGASIVAMSAYPSAACSDLDTAWNGSETVITDVNSTLEAEIGYEGGHFTADGAGTTDDYADISCGTETDGRAQALTFQPPS
jgi:hypothetical protein